MSALVLQSTRPTVVEIDIAAWAKWFNFETFEDHQIIAMVEKSARFVLAMRDTSTNRPHPHWLSLVGTSGAGKTYLAKRILRWAENSGRFRGGYDPALGDIRYATEFCHWPELAKDLQQNSGRERLAQLATTRFLVLDDIGAARDQHRLCHWGTERISGATGRHVDGHYCQFRARRHRSKNRPTRCQPDDPRRQQSGGCGSPRLCASND